MTRTLIRPSILDFLPGGPVGASGRRLQPSSICGGHRPAVGRVRRASLALLAQEIQQAQLQILRTDLQGCLELLLELRESGNNLRQIGVPQLA